MSSLDDAIRQMRAVGMPDFPPGHPIVGAGRVTRYGPKKKAWYFLYEFRTKGGAYVVGGRFGMWGEVESTKIDIDWKGISAEEREQHQRERAAVEARETAKREQKARFAGARARAQWDAAKRERPAGIETYLDRKGVAHERGIRYQPDGTVLLPMIRYDVTEQQEADPKYTGSRRLVGLQKITPDGEKRFNKGMGKEAAACRLGAAPKVGELVLVTEGLATGLSLVMALERRYACFVTFDAGNLEPALKVLRKLHPKNPLLICADDDAYLEASMNKLLRENYGLAELVRVPTTDQAIKGRAGVCVVSAEGVVDGDGIPGIVGAVTLEGRTVTFIRENTGRKKAHRAAEAVGNASVVFPLFKDRTLSADPETTGKLTDFNDLHQAEGLATVAAQLKPELERLAMSAELRKMVREEIGSAAPRRPKSDRAAGGGNGAGNERSVRVIDWEGIFDRYTLIYPTDTLWDADLRERVKLSNVKIAQGEQVMKWWLESPKRRMVNSSDLVFEPGSGTIPGKINLFRGMPLKPSVKGSCEKLRELLQYLCGEDGQDQAPVTEWVTKWLALPLQRPGGKNLTAIVMHGPEGTGKNMFFGAVREIYGEYGTLITQTELEDRFNGWLSRRLFLIANEVISRQEMRHHVGMLKNLVTEPVLPIREMFMPIRYERNHANLVFLTNEKQALQIMPGDRRYMVIWTPPEASSELYAEVMDEIRNGGVQALYAHLLDYPLGEFAEHTRPLMTQAKLDLIEIGLNSAQYFQQQLYAGLLHPMRYRTCRAMDLYRAYTAFCARTGERNPRPLNRFIHEFKAMNGVTHRVADIEKPVEGQPRRQAAVFFMGEQPSPEDQRDQDAMRVFVKKNVEEFAGELFEYLGEQRSRRYGEDGKDA